MKRLLSLLLFLPAGVRAELPEIIPIETVDVSAAKQHDKATATTVLTARAIERDRIISLRRASQTVPGMHVPEYGSRMTSSIYMRGLGSRIGFPTVGLVVDNVPILSREAFDFDLPDLSRVEVLRGPQSLLFGRNTMGGAVVLQTISPLEWQGTRLSAEYASGNTLRFSAGQYMRLDDRWGASVSATYGRSDGLFRNEYDGRRLDWERNAAGRVKVQYAKDRLQIENTLALAGVRQGGYPYASAATGRIDYNDESSYRRTALQNGLTIRYKSWTSVTSYQYLDDRMRLDQDFLPLSYFTLEQSRTQHALTEDVFVKGARGAYRWMAGVFGFVDFSRSTAPVLFKQDGLYNLILKRFEDQGVEAAWGAPDFLLASDFENPTHGAAVYHQSSWNIGRWSLQAGLRIDYEGSALRYRSAADATYTTSVDGVVYPHAIDIDQGATLRQHFVEPIPRVAAMLHFGTALEHTAYASVSKGYKAGGFNTQMFSDVLQQTVMKQMGFGTLYNVEDVVRYRPEKSWNYELGMHLHGAKWEMSAAAFYVDCRDQQLTVFPAGQTTGRMMTNAGRMRSVGAEASAAWRSDAWQLEAAYGYTDARFVRFNDGRADYKGKTVPYAPRHTLALSAAWEKGLGADWALALQIGAKALGPIYWDESNTHRQPFYALAEASARLSCKHGDLTLWSRNLTDTRHDVFYFTSIGNSFLQRGRGRTYGITLTIIL